MKKLIAMCLVTLLTAFAAVTTQASDRGYSQAELDQMLAPVALYPDSVLSNILIAATYPVELVQAARWSRDNPRLEGEAAIAAVEDMDWDPSVKALVAFPELLKRMDDDIAWTQRLGDAFMFQEAMVMDSIQGLRDRAYAAGNLRTNEHVRIVREEKSIAIQPARREVVYVPYYDPRVVYGSWWWHSHPPVYWSHPVGYYPRSAFYWGRPVYVSPSFYYSSFYWPQRHIVVVHHVHRHPQRWHYTPRHRPPAHQHRPPPRRDAHRDWADQRRQTYPRGFRGGTPQQVQGGGYTQRSPTGDSGHRGQRPPPTRQMQSAPLVDTSRPTNQYEGRGPGSVDRTPQRTRVQSAPQASPPVQTGPRGMPTPSRQMQSAPTIQSSPPAATRPAVRHQAPSTPVQTGPRGMPTPSRQMQSAPAAAPPAAAPAPTQQRQQRPARSSRVDSDAGTSERVR